MIARGRVLVTGGAGFIGSHACEALLAAGHAVRVLDDFSSGNAANIARIWRAIEVHEGSVDAPHAMTRAAAGCTAVVHLAALTSVAESMAEPVRYHRVNSEGTRLACAAARAAGCARLVFAASSSAYGDQAPPQHEDLTPRPLSPYAVTKVEGEATVRAMSAEGPCDGVSLRFFNVYGTRQDPNSAYAGVVARFLGRMRSGLPVTVFGDGLQTRDFIAVRDVAQAIVRAVDGPRRFGGEVVNIGTGRGTSILELARTVAGSLGVAPRIEHAEPRAGEVRDSVACTARAADLLGFRAETPLEAGLRSMI